MEPRPQMSPWIAVAAPAIVVGGGLAALFADSGRVVAAITGGLAAAVVSALITLWAGSPSSRGVPVGEFQAFAFTAVIYVALGVTGELDRLAASDLLLLFPTLSLLPPVLRIVLGGRGDPSGRPRRIVGVVHQVFGWFYALHGVLMVLSVWLIVFAPFSFVSAVLHWQASAGYRLRAAGHRGVVRGSAYDDVVVRRLGGD